MPLACFIALPLLWQSSLITYTEVKEHKPGYYSTELKLPGIGGSTLGLFATKQFATAAQKGLSGWMAQNKNDFKSKPRLEYFYQVIPTLSIAMPNVVSGYLMVNTFEGGAHPMSVMQAHTYAMVAGKPREVHAKDLFRTGVDFQSIVSTAVIQRLMTNNRAEWVQNGQVKTLTPAQVENFVVTPTSLVWLFDPYDMGPYAVGAFQVKIPLAELKGDLNSGGALASLLK